MSHGLAPDVERMRPMTPKSALLQAQAVWAASAGIPLGRVGYAVDYKANLFRPLSHAAKMAFDGGSGSELEPHGDRPAKMSALHSSSALAVNVFDYWSDKDLRPLISALGLDGEPRSFKFEEQFPTGLNGTPPNLDVAIHFGDGHVVGIESKFSEWFTPKPPGRPYFKEKYFAGGRELWTQVALPGAQRLAVALQEGREGFKYLDVAQLLKHMLGLGTKAPGRFALHYLFYDWPSPESEVHADELARFARAVANDAPFRWTTYQQLIAALEASGEADQEYLVYLQRRYLSD